MVPFRLLIVLITLYLRYGHAAHIVPRQVPLLSQADLDNVVWSQDHLKLVRGEHLYIYHNYTTTKTQDGQSFYRHLGREKIVYHRRLLRSYLSSAEPTVNLTKRGFIANPDLTQGQVAALPAILNVNQQIRYATWKWARAGGAGCRVQILLCYQSEDVRNIVGPTLRNAVAKWHSAFGDKRGVEFVFPLPAPTRSQAEAELCRNHLGNWRLPFVTSSAVEIVLGPTRFTNTIGWMQGIRADRMRLTWDAAYMLGTLNAGHLNTLNNGQMAHELGHILGLEHEHQRYDAPTYISYRWERLRDIELLDGHIAQYNRVTGLHITRDMVLYDSLWAEKMRRVTGMIDPPIFSFVRHVRQNDPMMLVDFEEIGPFDFDSIMLYGSWQGNKGGVGQNDAVMLKRSDGSTFGSPTRANDLISEGDVNAVKRMYPDVP